MVSKITSQIDYLTSHLPLFENDLDKLLGHEVRNLVRHRPHCVLVDVCFCSQNHKPEQSTQKNNI